LNYGIISTFGQIETTSSYSRCSGEPALEIILTHNKNGEKFMTITTDNKKYENALKSLEAKRKLSEARGYAAGASILANNNPKFIRWGKRAQFLVTAFFFILPNVLVLKYGLEWF